MKEHDGKPGGIEGAKALRPEGLVAYQPGSIVSRAIAASPAGTMTVFAFDEGQSLSEHTAPFDAYVHVLDGEVELTVGGEKVPASAGQIVLMPAGIPHAVLASKRFKMMLTLIRGRGTE